MSTTKIEWTDHVLNIVTGCTKVSKGCENCYAERVAKRWEQFYPEGFIGKITLHPERLQKLFKAKKPAKWFVCSMGDLFHPEVPTEYIREAMEAFRQVPHHIIQILTKRPERIENVFPDTFNWPENVWMGVTCEHPENLNRIWQLKHLCTAKVKFVSFEPLLDRIFLARQFLPGIDWVIVGGESGRQARLMHPDWAIEIKNICKEQGIPLFFKQWGFRYLIDNKLAQDYKMLEGKLYHEFPRR